MFPFFRFALEVIIALRKPRLPPGGVHVSHHTCMPWDIDFAMELNNGRTLTLYDLGRFPLAIRLGLPGVLRKNGWNFTMAGVVVRYRRRVTMFQRLEMRSQAIGRDARFTYILQAMYHKGVPTSSVVYRVAAFNKDGIVPAQKVADALGHPDWNPELPDWVQRWSEAEAERPWPPEFSSDPAFESSAV